MKLKSNFKNLFLVTSFLFVSSTSFAIGGVLVYTSVQDDSIASNAVVVKLEEDIIPPMAEELKKAMDQHQDKERMILELSSLGGSVEEGGKIIDLLTEWKTTKGLKTLVARGEKCGSMCVPIFLQGQVRIGARASSWMFHGVRHFYTTIPNLFLTDKFLGIFERAGVSETWILKVKPIMLEPGEIWFTGDDLINDESGIITEVIENRRKLPAYTMPIDPMIRPR
jgi:hypothetical protein